MSAERQIRKMVMVGDSGYIRNLLLTGSQIDTVRWVGGRKFATAADLSLVLGVSIQNASSKLNRLYKSGYLERLTTSAKSGGIEHIYRAQKYGEQRFKIER